MLVFDAVLEKLLEPIGIAALSGTEVCKKTLLRILDGILPILVVI